MQLPEIFYWLYLNKTRLFQSKTSFETLKMFTNIEDLFHIKPENLPNFGLNARQCELIRSFNLSYIEKDITWLGQPNHHIIGINDQNYPNFLKQIHSPPLLLYIKGDPSCLSNQQLAIVGSRKPTPAGQKIAFQFAEILASTGLTITSGLAYGIDAACHQGALQSGKTIAVLGTSLDRVYPTKHHDLFEAISKNAAVVSELAIGTPPLKENFPLRNRIISGLSLGVLVVEAALKSGSLITAKLALDQNREVFAIPGSIFNQQSQGCHHLIRQGALLVGSPADILSELSIKFQIDNKLKQQKLEEMVDLDQEHYTILQKIGYEVTNIEALLVASSHSLEKMNSILLNLELQSLIKSVPGGYCRT